MEYKLTAKVTISAYTTVEANSLSEAIKIAGDRNIDFQHIGNPVDESESWFCDEVDGEPYEIDKQ